MAKRTDHVSPKTRSAIMRAVKSRGSRSTEKRLRAALVSRGIRGWQMHAEELPGDPDFVFRDACVAIFVDGCFWHGCPQCYRRPHSNQEYWDQKVQMNMARDRRQTVRLEETGWRVIRAWEHEVVDDVKQVCQRIIQEVDRVRALRTAEDPTL